MRALQAVAPAQKRGAESSSTAGQKDEGYEPETYRSHHHDREAIGGFYEVQERLDLRTGITRGRLLHLVKHYASYFCTFMKDGER